VVTRAGILETARVVRVIEVIASLTTLGPPALLTIRDSAPGARGRLRLFPSFVARGSLRFGFALLGSSSALLGALCTVLRGAIFARLMLACTRVLRLSFSGRAEVKFLVPLKGGGVLVQIVHHGFVGTVGLERAA
jgi:hypothetical protein